MKQGMTYTEKPTRRRCFGDLGTLASLRCPVPFSYTLSFLHLLKSITCWGLRATHESISSLLKQSSSDKTEKAEATERKCKQARVAHEKRRNPQNGDKEALRKPMNYVSVHPLQMVRGAGCLNWPVRATPSLQCFSICVSHILFLFLCCLVWDSGKTLHLGSNWKLANVKFCAFQLKRLSRWLVATTAENKEFQGGLPSYWKWFC